MPLVPEKLFSPEQIMSRLYVLYSTLTVDYLMGDISKKEMEKRFGYALAAVGLKHADWERMYPAD